VKVSARCLALKNSKQLEKRDMSELGGVRKVGRTKARGELSQAHVFFGWARGASSVRKNVLKSPDFT
jgi:hypothetical protein